MPYESLFDLSYRRDSQIVCLYQFMHLSFSSVFLSIHPSVHLSIYSWKNGENVPVTFKYLARIA